MWQTDGQTDKWTDGWAELRWLRRATPVAAVARKNQKNLLKQKYVSFGNYQRQLFIAISFHPLWYNLPALLTTHYSLHYKSALSTEQASNHQWHTWTLNQWQEGDGRCNLSNHILNLFLHLNLAFLLHCRITNSTARISKLDINYYSAAHWHAVSVMRAISPFVIFAVFDVQFLKCCP